ncbi:MAG: ArsR/SmtB family transcription factor [Phycisphaerae bacterium]
MAIETAEKIDLLDLDALCKAATCLKVLAHPARLRIVDILMQGSFPVHRIAELCQLPPHQTCEHLRMMLGHGFLSSRRDGRQVLYGIAAPQLPGILQCIRSNCAAREGAPEPLAPTPSLAIANKTKRSRKCPNLSEF